MIQVFIEYLKNLARNTESEKSKIAVIFIVLIKTIVKELKYEII